MFSPGTEDDLRRAGRAARPSLCLLVVILVGLVSASTAQAALFPPILLTTNPASPGASTTPRIQGEIEELSTKVVTFGPGDGLDGPLTMGTPEPNNTVRLYTQAGCAGPVAGEGSAEELETVGIPLGAPVALESVTTFFATQENTEDADVSPCSSKGLKYRQVSSAPSAPALTSVSPASPANDNFPHLIGSADPEATVSIYPSTDCSGTAVAAATGAAFATPGIAVAVADNSESVFSARATMAGFSSPCSAGSIAYVEVTPPPESGGGNGGAGNPPAGGGTTAPPASRPSAPRLHTVPGGSANDNTPTLTGSAPGAATVKVFSSANCSGPVLTKGPASQLGSPGLPLQVADNTVTFLSATGVSAAGESPCSDPVLYVEDSTAPRTRITMGPAAKTAKRKAVIRFADTTGDAPGTVFVCRIDKAKWKQCSSPLKIKHLRLRRYVIQVKATDPAGNVELKGAKRSFKVIRHP